ncbi:MAG: YjbQ family protein [Phycisphaerae bacterium]|nr:YjbQ family protein [Phycisphaerae bacterium]
MMAIVQQSFSVKTSRRCEMIDITSRVEKVVAESGIRTGTVTVFCPHTTAAITINENADPDVVHDLLLTLEALIPQHRAGYRHNEGNSDAHVKSSLVGASVQVLVESGRMVLGTWQAIYFCEFDGTRTRNTIVKVMGE